MTSVEVEEINRHFGVVAESLEKRIQVVAEAVTQLDAKMDPELGSFRDEVSYAELDRRIEIGFASFEARLRRLEAS